MSILLKAGLLFGAAVGFAHAVGVYGRRLAEGPTTATTLALRVHLRAGYSALWAWALWTLFGTYVLVLWVISIPLWLVSRAVGGRPRSPAAG